MKQINIVFVLFVFYVVSYKKRNVPLEMRKENVNLPYFIQCSHCKYFVPDTNQDYRISKENKCTIFGKRDLITGEFTANNVLENRLNQSKCGINAFYYRKNLYAGISLFVAKMEYKIKSFVQKFRISQEELVLLVFLVPYFLFSLHVGILIYKTL